MKLTQKDLETLAIDAYVCGANDSTDIFLYVSKYGETTFEKVDAITKSLFGPINLTPCAPSDCLLN
jgi:hypothetical protein